MAMGDEKAKEIAELYASRGPMTRLEFLKKHQLKEFELRRATERGRRPSRQTAFAFASTGKEVSDRQRIADLEASNKRLLLALRAALVALEALGNKANSAIASVRQHLD